MTTDRPPWVLVTAGFHEHGGQSKANAALASHLLERGHTVHLVGHEIDARFAQIKGAITHLVPCPSNRNVLGWRPLERKAIEVATNVTLANANARVVANGGSCSWSDVNWVHCVHHAWGFADQGSPYWFQAKNRMVKWWARIRERRAIQNASIIIANSYSTRQQILKYICPSTSRLHVVYLGTDPTWTHATDIERIECRRRLGIPPTIPVVIFVGALSYDNNKGLDSLLSAWDNINTRVGWRALLLVAGDGNGLHKWQEKVRAMGLSESIRFLGFSQSLMQILPVADLLVSPVRYEAYGLNVHEAICRGVAAMVSSTAGVAERYPSDLQEMIVPNPNNWQELADKLLMWYNMIDYWRNKFTSFARFLREYTWNSMAVEMVQLIESGPAA